MNKLLSNRTLLASSLFFTASMVNAGDMALANKPLYTGTTEAPMMMLVMGRDHTLYYEAYNDASDLDNIDGLDIKFKPGYVYEGYFDSVKCYKQESNVFVPKRIADTCTESNEWSGNFLNYVTMTRMDVLRKVLYGGMRKIDDEDQTILERMFIPQDAHSWAKAYSSIAIDGYDIRDYTPFDLPDSDAQHFFASVTYTSESELPSLQVIKNAKNVNNLDDWGVWTWASTERPVLNLDKNKANKDGISSLYDLHQQGDVDKENFKVTVEVCVDGLLESNCKPYTDDDGAITYKPTGLLHDYGEDDQMLFGLLTGSYDKNLSGGVLRKAISQFSEEINSDTGQFTSASEGIVATIDKLKIHGFRYSNQDYNTNCGWITTRTINEGECASWGNPVGEMLYETMRYFSGASSPSATYDTNGNNTYDASLNLTAVTWDDPYQSRGTCSRPNTLLVSDINPSYDSDQLPGAYSTFASTYSGSVLQGDDGTGFNLTTLLNAISGAESISGDYFIGQSGTTYDGAPTEKNILGLSSIRGLAPAEPTKQGSYSSAAVAYFGLNNDIHPNKAEEQNVTTMVVALASNLPEISINVDGDTVKIVPFAKSVGGSSINSSESSYQPTNTIVDWYVESIGTDKGTFRINFEDVEQGADHDMDMIVKYSYEVKDLCFEYNNGRCKTKKGVEISLDSTYAAGGIDQHAGYIISGTTNDGMYLEVKDLHGRDVKYYLDTPDSDVFSNRDTTDSNENLGLTATRNFFPSETDAAEFLPSPLWYAAKWGGFVDDNNSGTPDQSSEWDVSGAKDGGADGDPDNYFPVTNAGELRGQLAAAFDLAFDGPASGTAPVFSSNFLVSGTLVYQTAFEEINWSGDVKAYVADTDGVYPTTETWSAAEKLDAMGWGKRNIFSRRNDVQGTVFKFEWPSGDAAEAKTIFTDSQWASLLIGRTTENKNNYREQLIKYIQGKRYHEAEDTNYDFRERSSRLGDIINSTPYHVSSQNGHDVKKEVLVFGANDGMVHIVNAANGRELAAYIPSGIYDTLANYAQNEYIHEYSVDGGISAYSDENDLINIGLTDKVGRTTVVGRLGLGVKGLYAIDVSKIGTPTAAMMSWEITEKTTGFEGLGYSISSPTIVKLAIEDSGVSKVGVIFNNGYNSSETDGAIYIANLSDGRLIKKLSVGDQTDPTGLGRPNALAQPTIIDNDGDGIGDHIFVGDLFGNMWVFDISSDDTDDWGILNEDNYPLFTAYSPTMENSVYLPQSITSRPSVARHPSGSGVLVAFGTGKYVEFSDTEVSNQATQSFYVIADKLDGTVVNASRDSSDENKFTDLQAQSIVKQNDTGRVLSSNAVDWDSVSGFYLDLVNTADSNSDNYGERQVGNSALFSNKVSFITLLPNEDACEFGGSGWYMELNLYTGQTWNVGTVEEDDPSTPDVDESIPSDSSHRHVDGIATDIRSVIAVPFTTIINEDGDEERVQEELKIMNCAMLSTGKSFCIEDDMIPTGRISWRQLY
ncbi:hypothetical protein GCM10007916_06070 [Psychromonas marina]|uniref:PilY1 beta-propeller domain-containing protein n=1 Tax=Psychromonas marina TaxID=88364 RepID=A0ABQ6DX17_9GAMM|nr:PilC/PilY family type IV pilus protein [Psychromonas marina]GLS89540.1 hypothetical protein GCM10007916_06070 [Psychromonas marina]